MKSWQATQLVFADHRKLIRYTGWHTPKKLKGSKWIWRKIMFGQQTKAGILQHCVGGWLAGWLPLCFPAIPRMLAVQFKAPNVTLVSDRDCYRLQERHAALLN